MKKYWRGLPILIVWFCSNLLFVITSKASNIAALQAYQVNNCTSNIVPTDSLFQYYFTLYHDSSLVFQRMLYNDLQTENEQQTLVQYGLYLKQKGSYKEAAKCFGEIDKYGLPDSLKYELYYQEALNYYLNADFEKALTTCIEITKEIQDSTIIIKSFPLQALVLNELSSWEEASLLILKMYHMESYKLTKPKLETTVALYTKKNRPVMRSPRKAMVLNSLLPGVGYIYAGQIKEGILNTGLQVVFVGFTGAGFYYRYYISTFFSAISLERKFYIGGIRRVEYLTEKRNYNLKRNYNQKLRNAILEL